MINPFKKAKLKINTKTFKKKEPRQDKPDIIKTFSYLYPDSPLKRSSRALMSLCPLHGESNPSFAMYEETNSYYCFSCRETGDSYTLIMEVEDLEFKEALQFAEENNLYD